jgi:alkylation response protein AidB-like acyl-CoA dehydrogenase
MDNSLCEIAFTDAAFRRRTCSARKDAACRNAAKALQISGGSGYCRGTVVERVYRDLRVLRIYEGASEIHRNMIAKQLLA